MSNSALVPLDRKQSYFDYLAKANLVDGLVPGGVESVRFQRTQPAMSAVDSEWMRLAAHLWANRPSAEHLSVGVCPCPNADDKGTFAAGLALVLRQALNKETLVIDMGLGQHSLAATLRATSDPGLLEFLDSEPAVRFDCIHKTRRPGVFVMPVGTMKNRFSAREFERRFRWLHSEVARHFPVVITRLPAVSSTRMPRRCWRIPGIAVLTVRPGGSRSSAVRREAQALRSARANLIGLVLTELQAPLERF